MSNKKVSHSLFGSHFTATISITLVLFLMGLISLLLFTAKDLSVYVKENLSMSLVLNDNIKEAEILKLQKSLDVQHYVKSTEYIDKETAAKTLTEELGEDPIAFLGYNPLLPSIEMHLYSNYANNDSISGIEQRLKKYPQIKEVIYQKDLVQAVNENIYKINLLLLGFAGVLLFISFALINNTIRLSVYSKRFLINTMLLIGADNGFIRRPFIWRHVLNGIIASFLAIGLIAGLLYYIQKELQGILTMDMINSVFYTFGIIFILGFFITLTGAFFAVNRYLRIKTGDLYYI